MKKSSYLINTARGDVVVENDLVQALEKGLIKGAGLDVFEGEPNVNPKLLNFKNVFYCHTLEALLKKQEKLGMRVFSNIRDFFDGKEPLDRVV